MYVLLFDMGLLQRLSSREKTMRCVEYEDILELVGTLTGLTASGYVRL